MSESLKHKAFKGAIWASCEKFGVMGLQFIVNLILARLLSPADFGAIGLIYIFIAVSQTLIDGGFGAALIQKKEPSQVDYSTSFYWNLVLALILYVALFLCSGIISDFYRIPELANILKVLGLSLIINSLVIIPKNRLQKNLSFKAIALINLSALIVSSAIAVSLAYLGYGVWSLVFYTLLQGFFQALLLWAATKWHPSFAFSFDVFKQLFSYGGFLLASNILQTICQNLQGLIIGRKFSAVQMGYYSQAQKLDQVFSYSIPQIIVQVMFPVFSSLQEDYKKLGDAAIKVMRIIGFMIFPLMAILILEAKELINIFYGEKWLPAVPYFRILCVGGLFVCLQNINFYVVASVGKSKTLFYWSFYKWGFLILALLVGMNFGMEGLLWGMVVSSFNIFMTNAALVQKFIGLKILRQLRNLIPSFIISILCGFLCYELKVHIISNSIISTILYICIYNIILKYLSPNSFNDIFILIKKRI